MLGADIETVLWLQGMKFRGAVCVAKKADYVRITAAKLLMLFVVTVKRNTKLHSVDIISFFNVISGDI
jgi:hypothetical protein